MRNMPDMQQSWSVRLILKSERRFGLAAPGREPGTRETSVCFSPTEKKTILRAEEKGRIKAGQVIAFSGCRRKVFGCDYSGLPDDTDAFVVFSGHPGAASPAVFAWFNHFRRTGRAVKLIFLGLTDNQGNSDFTDSSLIYNVGS